MFIKWKIFAIRYERRLTVFGFVVGFFLDNLTLQRVDRLYDNVVLAVYLFLALFSILFLNAYSERMRRGDAAIPGRALAQFFLPFALGGLFSGFFVFYSRSGSLLTSAPFLLVLLALFVGSELFKRHYERFAFQMCVFFVALFSYFALVIPVILRRMGDGIFILSGVLSLLSFFLIMRAVRRVARAEVDANRRILWPLIVMIFIFFNFLYFNNMIPPIPLSLKEIGVYHSVERTRAGEYRVTFEKAPWYALGQKTSSVFHSQGNAPIYVFSSVFAPTRLLTEIVHRWAYFDKGKGKWVDSMVIGFPISGGRQNGFRGYSKKETISSGRWRVDVETLRGQVIGRFSFEVVDASFPPGIKKEVR